MRRMHRIVLLAGLVALAPVLAGCEDFDMDKLDIFHLNEKKKLPGERKELFPQGVPGVTQGIPPEYMKGNQPPPDTALTPLPGEAAAVGTPPGRSGRCAPAADKDRRGRARTGARAEDRRQSRNRNASRSASRRSRQPKPRHSSRRRTKAAASSNWRPGRHSRSSRPPRPGRRRRRPAPSRSDVSRHARARPAHPSGEHICGFLMDCRVKLGNNETYELHHRHCRPPQCRQIDAVQPAGRPARRAGRRPAGRDARPPRRRGPARRSRFHRDRYRGARGVRAREPHRPHAGADRDRDRAGRRDLLHDRRARRSDRGRPRFRRTGAQVGQAGRADRQQDGRAPPARRAGSTPMRSALATRWRFRPSTTRAWPISTTRCARRCPNAPRRRSKRRPSRPARIRSASPLSGGRMPANRRWSTG